MICYLDVGSLGDATAPTGRLPEIGDRQAATRASRTSAGSTSARSHLLAKPLKARFDLCTRKGFDAVEPDNDNGFDQQHRLPDDRRRPAPLQPLGREAGPRQRGMSVALKNDPSRPSSSSASFDFAVVEQCFQYHECGQFSPFIDSGKAVFEAEYELSPSKFCDRAGSSALQRHPQELRPLRRSPGARVPAPVRGRAGRTVEACARVPTMAHRPDLVAATLVSVVESGDCTRPAAICGKSKPIG